MAKTKPTARELQAELLGWLGEEGRGNARTTRLRIHMRRVFTSKYQEGRLWPISRQRVHNALKALEKAGQVTCEKISNRHWWRIAKPKEEGAEPPMPPPAERGPLLARLLTEHYGLKSARWSRFNVRGTTTEDDGSGSIRVSLTGFEQFILGIEELLEKAAKEAKQQAEAQSQQGQGQEQPADGPGGPDSPAAAAHAATDTGQDTWTPFMGDPKP